MRDKRAASSTIVRARRSRCSGAEPARLLLQRRRGTDDGGQRRAVVVRDRGEQGVAHLLRLRTRVCRGGFARGLQALEGHAHQVAERLCVQAQQGVVFMHVADHDRAAAAVAALHRQVPGRQLAVAVRAGPHRLALSHAVPQPGALVGVHRPDQRRGLRVFMRRQLGLERKHGHRLLRQRRHRVAQAAQVRERLGGIAQRLAPLAQLLGATGSDRRAPMPAGAGAPSAPRRRHSRRPSTRAAAHAGAARWPTRRAAARTAS